MSRMSLRWRVAVAFGLCSVMVTGVLAVVTWQLASGYMLRQREMSTTRQAEVNVRLVDAALRAGSGGLDELLTGLSTNPTSTVLLVRDGAWLTSGRRIDPAALPEPLLTLAQDSVPVRQRLVVDGLPVMAVGLPVPAGGTFIELFPLVELTGTLRFLSLVLVGGTALGGLFGIGLGLWASRRALRPLTALTTAASRVARGDLDARLPEQADPDLAPLATTFNSTAAALQQRVQRDARFASDVSHELRSPLTTMVNATELLSRGEPSCWPRRPAGRPARRRSPCFQRMVVDLLEISAKTRRTTARYWRRPTLAELVATSWPRDRMARPTSRPTSHPRCSRRPQTAGEGGGQPPRQCRTYGGGAVRVAVCRRGGRLRLEVDDRGPGVPEELRERVSSGSPAAPAPGNAPPTPAPGWAWLWWSSTSLATTARYGSRTDPGVAPASWSISRRPSTAGSLSYRRRRSRHGPVSIHLTFPPRRLRVSPRAARVRRGIGQLDHRWPLRQVRTDKDR